jgi:hypothetical protein
MRVRKLRNVQDVELLLLSKLIGVLSVETALIVKVKDVRESLI